MRFALAILIAATAHADVIDRIAVTVGKQVITLSDIVRDIRVSAFLDRRPLDLSGPQKRLAADRLVEQMLILQEASLGRTVLADSGDAQKILDQTKLSFYPTDAEYRAALARYGITEGDVLAHLLAGLSAMRFTDLRFRPEVQLTDDELHDYYNKLAEGWRKKDPANVPSFDDSREQVEKLLTDERTAQGLDRWLGSQRSEVQILFREQAFQ